MLTESYTIRRFIVAGLVAIISLALPEWAAAGDLPGVARAIGVQVHHSPALMKRPGVVGTAVGLTASGAPAITIYTEKLGIGGLPKLIDGIEVVVKVTGKILPLHHCKGAHASDPACVSSGEDASVSVVDPAVRFARPVPIGVSAGNVKSITTDGFFISCSGGTLGARLTDGRSSLGFGLSNNHVFALSNQRTLFTDPIVQPSPADADPVCSDYANADTIGFLEDYEPIEFSTEANNQIDAAIAREPSVD